VWSSRWNENWPGKPKYSDQACRSATLSTTKSHMTWPGIEPCRRGGKPATNRLSYGTALWADLLAIYFLCEVAGIYE
jgi:hypothetical protein